MLIRNRMFSSALLRVPLNSPINESEMNKKGMILLFPT